MNESFVRGVLGVNVHIAQKFGKSMDGTGGATCSGEIVGRAGINENVSIHLPLYLEPRGRRRRARSLNLQRSLDRINFVPTSPTPSRISGAGSKRRDGPSA